jgi:hypothetical protein
VAIGEVLKSGRHIRLWREVTDGQGGKIILLLFAENFAGLYVHEVETGTGLTLHRVVTIFLVRSLAVVHKVLDVDLRNRAKEKKLAHRPTLPDRDPISIDLRQTAELDGSVHGRAFSANLALIVAPSVQPMDWAGIQAAPLDFGKSGCPALLTSRMSV